MSQRRSKSGVAQESHGSPRADSRRRRPLRFLLLLVVLGIAVHLLLPQFMTLRHSVEVLRGWKWWATALAVAAQTASYAGSGYLLHASVRLFRASLPLRQAVMVSMASASVGLLWGGPITSAGAAFRWLRRRGVSSEGALVAGWLPGLINIVTLSAISVIGLVHLLVAHELTRGLAIAFSGVMVVLLLLGGAGYLGLSQRQRLTRIVRRASRLASRIRRRPHHPARVDAGVANFFAARAVFSHGGWRGPVAGDIANVGFDMLTLYLLFVAAGHPVSPGILLAGYALPLLLGKLSFLPGGVGVVEGSMVALYSVLGVPSTVTVLVVLGYRLLSFWLPIALGFPLAIVLDRERP